METTGIAKNSIDSSSRDHHLLHLGVFWFQNRAVFLIRNKFLVTLVSRLAGHWQERLLDKNVIYFACLVFLFKTSIQRTQQSTLKQEGMHFSHYPLASVCLVKRSSSEYTTRHALFSSRTFFVLISPFLSFPLLFCWLSPSISSSAGPDPLDFLALLPRINCLFDTE